MPAPKKPTSVLAASGAFEKNPQRAAGRGADAVSTVPLGPAPDYLDETEQRCWAQIVAKAATGALRDSDWIAVLATTRLLAKLETGTITAAEHGQLKGYLQELGMTPKARANVQIPKEQAGNPFTPLRR